MIPGTVFPEQAQEKAPVYAGMKNRKDTMEWETLYRF